MVITEVPTQQHTYQFILFNHLPINAWELLLLCRFAGTDLIPLRRILIPLRSALATLNASSVAMLYAQIRPNVICPNLDSFRRERTLRRGNLTRFFPFYLSWWGNPPGTAKTGSPL
jgi:hypothetical protein